MLVEGACMTLGRLARSWTETVYADSPLLAMFYLYMLRVLDRNIISLSKTWDILTIKTAMQVKYIDNGLPWLLRLHELSHLQVKALNHAGDHLPLPRPPLNL